jgi:hypothetical protein
MFGAAGQRADGERLPAVCALGTMDEAGALTRETTGRRRARERTKPATEVA